MKNVHLVCNAHLDPVWLWRWDEGAGEALSTFRVAVEMIEKFDSFVFNHNEAILYQWVEQFEPSLFNAIKKHVKNGRWNIMGGWYLQPDCNMPSGESFVRQVTEGKRYFQDRFGKDIRTAINFDPFGHSRGMVQVMAKCGFDSYLFGRPDKSCHELPGEVFRWKGYDGSQLTCCRFSGWYNSLPGKGGEEVAKRVKEAEDWDPACILWGIGNHGGGPSRKDVVDINKFIKRCKEQKVFHSTPQEYFREVEKKKRNLPEFSSDINPWAVGCYTSQIRIKQKHRQLENELYSAEKMCTAAWIEGLIEYPEQELKQAELDLLKSEFHDALPGSGIQEVEEDTIRLLDHGLEILSRVKAGAFFALCSGQKKAKEGVCPLMIYNPHAFEVTKLVEVEIHLTRQGPSHSYRDVKVVQGSRELVSQVEKESSNQNGEWRKRISFTGTLKPGMNRFDCEISECKKGPVIRYPAKKGKYLFRTKDMYVEINKRTGLMDSYRVGGRTVLGPGNFRPVIVVDDADPWSMFKSKFGKVCGTFRAASGEKAAKICGVQGKIDPIRIIEDGPARTIIESVLCCADSAIVVLYKLPKVGTEFEMELRVYWNEKDRMLKLCVQPGFEIEELIGQDAFGVKQLFADGSETVCQKWAMMISHKRDIALSIVDDGIYGSDIRGNSYRLSLLRSAAYSASPVPVKQDRLNPRIDQGERVFRFWVNASNINERIKKIDREALCHNEKEYSLNFFPSGEGKLVKPVVEVSDKVIQVPVVKKAFKGNDIIIRLFEPTGRSRKTRVRLRKAGKSITSFEVRLGSFELKTFRVNPRTGNIKEVNLLEKKL